jgi:hypothetical protein
MTPKILLRVAALAAALFALGHTLGGMIFAKSHGPDGEAVLAALGAYRFDMMGFSRSHLDFYVGEGWFLTATLAALIVMCWLLSNATAESPALVGRLSLVIGVFFAVGAGLSGAFFFMAPLVMCSVAALACGTVWWKLRAHGATEPPH